MKIIKCIMKIKGCNLSIPKGKGQPTVHYFSISHIQFYRKNIKNHLPARLMRWCLLLVAAWRRAVVAHGLNHSFHKTASPIFILPLVWDCGCTTNSTSGIWRRQMNRIWLQSTVLVRMTFTFKIKPSHNTYITVYMYKKLCTKHVYCVLVLIISSFTRQIRGGFKVTQVDPWLCRRRAGRCRRSCASWWACRGRW
jgi:hypothetical protein